MVGVPSTVTKLAADVTEGEGVAPPVVKTIVTVFAPALTAPIVSFKVVSVPRKQDPIALVLQVADASCDEEMKFEPLTVMVLPA